MPKLLRPRRWQRVRRLEGLDLEEVEDPDLEEVEDVEEEEVVVVTTGGGDWFPAPGPES